MHLTLLLDTSFSMCQKSYMGLSYMDIAKAAIDNFLKTRPVEPDGKFYHEKVQLFTTEFSSPDRAFTLVSPTSDTIIQLHNKLKYLKPHGARDLKRTVFEVYKYIDLYRLSTGIDSISMGRFPFFNEPTIIILISCNLLNGNLCVNYTLGGSSSSCDSNSQVKKAFVDIAEQSSFYHQPYRWDQRFYVIDIAPVGVLCRESQITNYKHENAFLGENFFFNMSMETNGQWVPIYNESTLSSIGFSLKAPCYQQETVIPVWFVKLSSCELLGAKLSEDSSRFNLISTLDYVREEFSLDEEKQGVKIELMVPTNSLTTNYYPIPEEYYPPNLNPLESIPLRDSIPVIVVSEKPMMRPACGDLPVDKYHLDAIQFPDYIIDNVENSMHCLPCYVFNSGENLNSIGESFGYVALDKKEGYINLYILPYNYLTLIPLSNEWTSARGRVNKTWRDRFDAYFRTIPYYCVRPIRAALKKVGISVSQYVSDANDLQFNRRADQLIRTGKPIAKKLYDQINMSTTTSGYSEMVNKFDVIMDNENVEFNIPAEKIQEEPDFRTLLFKQAMPKFEKIDMENFLCPPFNKLHVNLDILGEKPGKTQIGNKFANPFNIQRDELVSILPLLYDNICKSSVNKIKPQYKDNFHNVSIELMGNYHANDAHQLRPIDPTLTRTHSFGNPFKTRQTEYDFKVDETTDSSDLSIPAKTKETAQVRKQREYKNRRRRFLSQRVGRIRRSLSQSYLDSLDNIDSANNAHATNDSAATLSARSGSPEFNNEDDGSDVQIIDDPYSNLFQYELTSDEGLTTDDDDNINTSSLLNSVKLPVKVVCGKTFFTTIKKFIHLIRMHIMNTKSIEKLIKENCSSYNVQRFVSCLKSESLKYRRWDSIRPIVERYIDISFPV